MSHNEGPGPAKQTWLPQGPEAPMPEAPMPQGLGQVPPVAYPAPSPYAGTPVQPGYPQPGYAQPGYAEPGYYGQPAPKAPAVAIVGLVLAFIVPPVGLILSLVAISRSKRAGTGKGLAIGGIVVGTLLTILGFALVPFILNATTGMTDARAAVIEMQDSLIEADCAAFMNTTTPRLRGQVAVTTCDDFQSMIDRMNAGPVQIGNIAVIGVVITGDTAIVTTMERVSPGQDGLQAFDYTVVRQDGAWLVDWVDLGG